MEELSNSLGNQYSNSHAGEVQKFLVFRSSEGVAALRWQAGQEFRSSGARCQYYAIAAQTVDRTSRSLRYNGSGVYLHYGKTRLLLHNQES